MDEYNTEANVSTLADEIFSVLRVSEKTKDTHTGVGEDESNDVEREEGEDYYEGEEEEGVEEISESELLAMLDAEQDPMLVCRAIFKQNPTENSIPSDNDVLGEGAWRELWTQGWTVVDNVVAPETCANARDEALNWWKSGILKPPRSIMKEGEDGGDCGTQNDENELDPFRDHSARDDVIRWMHHYLPSTRSKEQEQELADTPGLKHMLSFMDSKLRPALNQFIHLRGPVEVQLACYAPENGGRYEKHRDSFPCGDLTDEDQRRVTCIFYLNTPDWNMETDGGALRVFGRPNTTLPDAPEVAKRDYDVEPKCGRLLIFLSGVVDHAVLPSNKQPRVAMTAWLR